MDTPQRTRITVIPTGAALGADVAGADLSRPISDETFTRIEDAWHTDPRDAPGALHPLVRTPPSRGSRGTRYGKSAIS